MWKTLNRVNLTGKKNEETESCTPFVKSLLGASAPPGAESDFRPTMSGRKTFELWEEMQVTTHNRHACTHRHIRLKAILKCCHGSQ